MHADKSLVITLTKGSHFAYIIRFNNKEDGCRTGAGRMAFIEVRDIKRRVLHDWIVLQIIRNK